MLAGAADEEDDEVDENEEFDDDLAEAADENEEEVDDDKEFDEVDLSGAVGPWESFGRCLPPVMPFLLRSVLIILKFFFLKSALSPKSFMTSITLPVIILNARWCSWRTSGLVTLPHLEARETLVFGAGAQTGCLVNTIHLNITIFDVIDILITLHASVNLWRWCTDRLSSLSPSGSTSSHQIHFDPPHP